jgi:hypothetical protein
MRLRSLIILLTVACEAETSGDESESTGDSSGEVQGVDADAVLSRALDYREALERVTAASAPSQHGLADTVHVWIDPSASSSYRALDPASDESSDVAFPEDTLFVKEHLDADGTPAGLTLMFRGADGYAPESADWWWGRTNAAGALQDEGQVGFCIDCHAGANAEAYVFGVVANNQTPG